METKIDWSRKWGQESEECPPKYRAGGPNKNTAREQSSTVRTAKVL